MSEENFDFIAIGDIVDDAFIRLKNASVHCDLDKSNCKICMNFGDKIPYEFVKVVPAVGNSPNASVSASRLGLKSALFTNIGDDQNGKEAVESLKKDRVDTSFVKVHPGRQTNYHYVLWYGDERTILIKHEEYDYVLPDLGNPKWLYLSSLAENSIPLHHDIANWLRENPDTKMAFQPGTFQIALGYEKLKDIYELSEIFFCNLEESQRILKTEEKDIKKLLSSMKDLGPKIVVITDGKAGAYTFDGQEVWHMPIYPDPAPPLDRTGAGDSFSSTFTSALALGKTIPEALSWGPINSMNVVQHIGAQEGLLTREQLEKFLAEAPENYKPKKI
ncbi:MAG TPA: carbohydrate kinase family protein [Candidatus Vogelbacteria bacterium]|nr:carbohydrate kinase family protein [Candidatus Vogelbacteria bacterium]